MLGCSEVAKFENNTVLSIKSVNKEVFALNKSLKYIFQLLG